MTNYDISSSLFLRVSLKRGLAVQAITMAERDRADLAGLWHLAAKLRPNAKGVDRLARQIKAKPGVISVSLTRDRKIVSFIARIVCDVEARRDGQSIFHETGLIYFWTRAWLERKTPRFQIGAVSFCAHALERLVERSDVPIEATLLPEIDTEAQEIFRRWERESVIQEDGDDYYPAIRAGVWAGGHDEMAPDPEWGINPISDPSLPIFSARTFLSAEEMKPTVWLRWKDDPTCLMI